MREQRGSSGSPNESHSVPAQDVEQVLGLRRYLGRTAVTRSLAPPPIARTATDAAARFSWEGGRRSAEVWSATATNISGNASLFRLCEVRNSLGCSALDRALEACRHDALANADSRVETQCIHLGYTVARHRYAFGRVRDQPCGKKES
jgi:hypothetical protein